MCPHCIAAAIGVVVLSIPAVPYIMSKFPRRSIRQDAMKSNFDQLYGKDENATR